MCHINPLSRDLISDEFFCFFACLFYRWQKDVQSSTQVMQVTIHAEAFTLIRIDKYKNRPNKRENKQICRQTALQKLRSGRWTASNTTPQGPNVLWQH